VRSFGQVSHRVSGGVADWAGEEIFCRANSALRFPDHLRRWPLGSPPFSACVAHALRRFNCDGTVAKLETGLRLTGSDRDSSRFGKVPLLPRYLETLLTGCAMLPLRVRGSDGTWKNHPLIGCAPALAQLYLRATTYREAIGSAKAWWLSCGDPTILVECGHPPWPELPRDAKQVLDIEGVSLHHWWRSYAGARCSIWLLRPGTPNREMVRRLRINLLRINAERECLKQVVRQILRGNFQYTEDMETSDLTQQYLNDSIRVLERSQRGGIPQSVILDTVRKAADEALPGELTTLLQMRRQVRLKVQRFVERLKESPKTMSIGEQMNTTVNITGSTISGDITQVVARSIRESFNHAENSGAEPELREKLQVLTREIERLVAKLPSGQAETVSRDLQTIVREATSAAPRADWYKLSAKGLIEAANTVAEMAGPVTKAVNAVVGLLAP
jgi:hypothetical protein